MSSYFDKKANEIRDFRRAGETLHSDAVRAWVAQLRADIAIACEYDREGSLAFPEDLRDAIYKMFLRHAEDAWPCGVPGYGVDYETDDQGMQLLADLVERLHDLFHAAAHAGWPGRDNPRSAVQAMDCRMEERCIELIAVDSSLTLGCMDMPGGET